MSTCGVMKTEVFEYGDVINYILLTLRMLREGCYRFYIVLRFRVDGRKRFEYAKCERVLFFLKNGGQKFSVFKSIGYLWTGPKPTAFFAVFLTSPSSSLKVPIVFFAYYKLLIITKVRLMDKYRPIYALPSTF